MSSVLKNKNQNQKGAAVALGAIIILALLWPSFTSAHWVLPNAAWPPCPPPDLPDHNVWVIIPPACRESLTKMVLVNWLDEAASKAVATVTNILVTFLGSLITLAGSILDWAISADIPYIKAPDPDWPVHVGWKIVRDFTNMGFVLGIVVIAISTILRFESYGMKKLLLNLVVAAILVNFSLIIMGVILDPANLLMSSFTDAIKNIGGASTDAATTSVSWKITAGMATINDAERMAKSFSEAGGGSALFRAIIMGFFTILFLLLFFIVLVALAIMMVIRHAVIWILAIIAPLAFLLWVFPGTQEHWRKWWDTFIRWTIFGPAALFFVWLSVSIVAVLNTNPPLSTTTALPSIVGQPLNLLMMYVMLIVLLMMSLTVAHQFGIMGAKAAMDFATKAARWPQRTLAREGQRTLAGTGFIGQTARKIESWTAGRPIVGGIGDLIGRTRGQVEKRIQDQGKVIENLSNETLVSMIRGRGRTPENALAIMDVLDKRGALGDVPKDVLARWLPMAERFGREKKVLNVRPTLAPLLKKDIGEVAREIPAKKITDVPAEEFFANQVALSAREGKIKNLLGDPGSKDQLNALLLGLQTAATSVLRDELLKALTKPKSPIAQARYDQATGKFIA